MGPMLNLLARLRPDQRAATAIEYALLASLIAVVIAGAAAGLGEAVVPLIGDPELLEALG